MTRIARLTGLDRTGVQVASAIRPRGHVLAVTNGKGWTFEAATAGALHEAAELWAAERPVSLVSGTAAEVRERYGAAIGPEELEPGCPGAGARLAWCEAVELTTGAPVLVPAAAVFCPPPGSSSLGPGGPRWTSNGMGASSGRGRAIEHALCELLERDRLARALPEGFTPGEVRRRLVVPGTLPEPVAARVAEIEARGFRVHFLDLDAELDAEPPTPVRPERSEAAQAAERSRRAALATSVRPYLPTPVRPERSAAAGRAKSKGLGQAKSKGAATPPTLPAFAALLVDLRDGPVPVAAGYACRLDAAAALEAALLEAAQSRATEIHGAREDVASGDRTAGAPLAPLLARNRPARALRASPRPRGGAQAALAAVAAAGDGRVACVDLLAPGGLHVVKILAPGLLLSELL